MDSARARKPSPFGPEGSLSPVSALFAVLGFVFLFLYVQGAVRAGVMGIAQKLQAERSSAQYESQLADLRRERDAATATAREAAVPAEPEGLREDIATRLKKEFARAGVAAEVDPRTGEVAIPFAQVTFDYNSDQLKPRMKSILRKAIPTYARAVLSSRATSEAIAGFEIVGFASPTYGGKYVDPAAFQGPSREGLNYNMELSTRRARAIFEFAFDPRQLRFPHQERMLRMTKVSGVSHLQADPARPGAKGRDFCSRYDCAAHQKVLLRFSLRAREPASQGGAK
ncbi:MAG: hypothetical protein IT285_02545 [Bdellovibrionales bacterium]|nr:hypothetical protein [Bdellovibrionales bacterium]